MQKRQSVEDRKIAAARRLRTLQGARYGVDNRTLVELAIADPQFVIMSGHDPANAYLQEFTFEYDFALRVLDAGGLVSIGNARLMTEMGREMLPVAYDGAGMFWWLKASPVSDVATAIKEDALSYVDQALARTTWSDEDDAMTEARCVLATLSGKYAVLPDNTILLGSAAPAFRLADDGEWLFLELFDKHTDRLQPGNSAGLGTRHHVPISFGILEYAAADEFLQVLAERHPDRKVAKNSLVERRDTGWVSDFTHNRERWADGGVFTEFVSALNTHVAALKPKGNKALDDAFTALQFHTKMWLHDHDAVNAKLDEILNLRELLLESDPLFDEVLAQRLKWPCKVKPLELLEIRARGLKELIAEPAFSPSP
jgi:hypothetical protein